MAATLDKLTTPSAKTDYRVDTGHRALGLGVGAIGLVIATVVGILAVVAGIQLGDGEEVGSVLAVAFGLNTVALATLKIGIAIILIGILVRLWLRVQSIKASLPGLKADSGDHLVATGSTDTPYGKAAITTTEPKELPIHAMAKTLWGPMLLMGAMLVAAGFVVSLVWAGNIESDPETALGASAWTQGLQFLGEAFVLAGISFLLGSILRGLRQGGGSVQEALGVSVTTLEMPATAKAFIALMVSGVMLGIAQLVLYIVTTTFDTAADVATWFAWLGPLRELSLGLLLAGIVLALATIGRVLGFQFWRISDIVATGR
jgi:hypothetical protein